MHRRDFIKVAALNGVALSSVPRLLQAREYTSFDNLPDAPAEYTDQPGTWSVHPEVLTAGAEMVAVQLRYVHSGKDMPVGTILRVLLEPITVKDHFHGDPSEGLKLVPFKGDLPNVKMEPDRVNGVGFRKIDFIFPDGLNKGDSFAVEMGNQQPDGSIKALVASIPVANLSMETYAVLNNGTRKIPWLNKTWRNGLLSVSIRPDKAGRVRMFGPSLVQAGRPFDLRIAVTDRFGGRSNPYLQGTLALKGPGVSGLPSAVDFVETDKSFKRLKGLVIAREGIYRIQAELPGGNRWFESHPIVVREEVDEGIYWGAFHQHSKYSECWGDSLDDTYACARDMAGYDWFATSDHKGQRPEPDHGASRLLMWRERRFIDADKAWQDNVRTAEKYNNPPEFLTLCGYELSTGDSGHYNVYWLDPRMDRYEADKKKHFLPYYTDYVNHLHHYLKNEDVLLIPHLHAAPFPFLSLEDYRNTEGLPLTPVVEAYSDWGAAFQPFGVYDSESKFGALRTRMAVSYLEALERGYRLGLMGDSDSHTGYPGRPDAGGISPTHDHPQGLSGVRMPLLSGKDLFSSLRRKNVYGTTGSKAFLDFTGNGQPMGSDLYADDAVVFNIEYAGTDKIKTLRLYNGLELVKEWQPGTRDFRTSITCRPWAQGVGNEGGAGSDDPTPAVNRKGNKTTLIPGSGAEQYFLVKDNQSKQMHRFRFSYMDSSFTYGFKLGRHTQAELLLDIDLQFKVSVSTDGTTFTPVLEEEKHLTREDVLEKGNRAMRKIDLSEFLATSEGVFVRIEDKWKEDGLGGRLHKLVIVSGSAPRRLDFPEKTIRYRFKDRVHPYVVEVVQDDEHRAWSSPIWVERKTIPDLAWEDTGAQLLLVNKGPGAARDVAVAYSGSEYCRTVPSVPLTRLPAEQEDLFFVWTEQVNARLIRVHPRWYGGKPLDAVIRLRGITGYRTERSHEFRIRRGSVDDSSTGLVNVMYPQCLRNGHRKGAGLSFGIEIDPLRPNRLELTFARPVPVQFGDRRSPSESFVIPLNGRRSARPLEIKTVSLEPGEKAVFERKVGYWEADPEDRIIEHDKVGNFVEVN